MAWRLAAYLLLISLTSVASSREAGPQRVEVAAAQMADLIVKNVAPVYPPMGRKARIQGTVVLRVEIGKSGNVESIQVVSGHPVLAPAAIEAVKQWEYKPYLLNGEPVEVESRVTVNFTLVEPHNRWKNIQYGHELYCSGHLIEAAVAYEQATHNKKLLDVACKLADHIANVFGPDKRHETSGHEEIELALIKPAEPAPVRFAAQISLKLGAFRPMLRP